MYNNTYVKRGEKLLVNCFTKRKRKTMNVKNMNCDISSLLVEKMKLSKEMIELEKSIPKGYSFSDLPRDTSNFNDEKIITFIESRDKILHKISEIDTNISKLRETVKFVIDTINELPECEYKTVAQMYFIDSFSAKEISCKTKLSRSSIYKEISVIYKSLF